MQIKHPASSETNDRHGVSHTDSTAQPHKRKPREHPDVSHFDKLPDAALIAIGGLAAVLSKGVSTVWRDVQNDPDFPRPIRLGVGCTRFSVGDIRAYVTKKANDPVKPKRFDRSKGLVAL